MTDTYLPSTTAGLHWQIGTMKLRTGFVAGTAVEGERGHSAGFNTFGYDVFGARRETVATTAKRATAKAEAEALRVIKAHLIEKGLVAA